LTMASLTTIRGRGLRDQESFLLTQIQSEPLPLRLLRQLRGAASDLASNPRGFVQGILSTDNRDQARRQILYAGFALGVVIYAALLTLVLVVGLKRILRINSASPDQFVWLPPRASLTEEPVGEGKPDANKGELGGGGSGQHEPRPVSQGALPTSAPHPPIVRPNPSNIPAPSLPTLATVVGPSAEAPPPIGPIGFPKGDPGDFAPGPGDGGNIGTGKGQGAGSGSGGGTGPGSGGNKGGGEAGLPSGSGSRVMTDYDWALVRSKPGFVPISWIHRPVPFVTAEARQNKVEGDVILRATFMADGTITDIQVVNNVDFMTESALESLQHSKFRPATVNGVPINAHNVIVRVRVSYKEVLSTRP